MWTLLSSQDHMRFQESGLLLWTRQKVLKVLTGVPLPAELPGKNCLMYRCKNKDEFVKNMPPFDEWGRGRSARRGLVRTLSSWFPSLPLMLSSPQVTVQVGELWRRPVARVLRSTCRVVILGHRPQEPATPLLRRPLLRRRSMRLPRPRLQEPREVMVKRCPTVRRNRAPL